MAAFSSIVSIHPPNRQDPSADCLTDLHLDQVFEAITAAGENTDTLRRLFLTWARDADEIAYRHEVFADLEKEQNYRVVNEFLHAIAAMRDARKQADKLWHAMQQRRWTVHAMDTYCRAVTGLRCALDDADLTSRGLRDFRDYLDDYADSEGFVSLWHETREVQSALARIRYTVQIKDQHIEVDRYTDQPDHSPEVAQLFERFRQEAGRDYRIRIPDYPDMNHVEEQILDRVTMLHPEEFARLVHHCAINGDFVDDALDRFASEVHFYLSYLAFMKRFTSAGLQFCYPKVSEDLRGIYADDAFDLALALKQPGVTPVRNDFRLSNEERILIVTGPNQGGKTTFARTIGQICYLAALGCPVPAAQAAVRLPDRIFTHFERQESIATLHGKLDDELVRIHAILSQATGRSVIVMNESFASTTLTDALHISTEVLHRIADIGCVTVFVSFLDELAELLPSCVSMVGGVEPEDPTVRTFRFTRRPADGLAYAAALADKYGLSPEILGRRVTRCK